MSVFLKYVRDLLLCRLRLALGLDDLATDPLLATNAGRVAHRDRVVAAIAAAVARRPAADWIAALDAVGYSGALSIEFEAYSYYKQVLGSDPSAAAVLAAEQARALVGGGP